MKQYYWYRCCHFKVRKNYQDDEWTDMYDNINRLLKRKCSSIYYPHLDYKQTDNCSKPLLFHCRNSQTCLSRHRVFDGGGTLTFFKVFQS